MTTNINANLLESGSDELERYALEECIKRQRLAHRTSVLIVPADRCQLAGKFARLGASVLLGDDQARQQSSEGRILAMGLGEEIRFIPLNLAELPDDLPGEPFDLIVFNHGLCGMGYEPARKLVRQLLFKLRIGGKLYVSVLGLHSELGDGYPDQERPVAERLAPLAPAIAKKYGIDGPVCLYSERNLFMLLLDAGASVLRTLTTTYGNVKGVAVRV
jgi:SAM-dependent methyltransferase